MWIINSHVEQDDSGGAIGLFRSNAELNSCTVTSNTAKTVCAHADQGAGNGGQIVVCTIRKQMGDGDWRV